MFKLKWDKYVDPSLGKLTSANFLLYQLRSIVDSQTLKMVYFGLFHSVMCYSLSFWGGQRSTMDRIFILQKRANRTVFKMRIRETCRSPFRNAKILYILEISVMIHKNIISLAQPSHEHDARSKNSYVASHFQTSML